MATAQNLVDERLDGAALRALEARLVGNVIRPGDEAYDQDRQVWNRVHDRHPAAIVRAREAADVLRAVDFARTHELPLAVRSGGHSMAGHGTVDGGLVLDLSSVNGLRLDVERRTAWAQPGLTWGEYSAQAQAHGLATPAGDASSVGVGGLTLGGGIGWLVRKHGLTVDHLLAAEVVTAAGRLITASEDEHPDLFWALRGGGGNAGIATGFRFRLLPVGTVIGGALVYEATAATIRDWAAYASQAPDELTTIAVVMNAPPAPFIPPERHGSLVFVLFVCYTGSSDDGRREVAALRSLGPTLADTLSPMPYASLFALSEGGAVARPHSVRSAFLPALDGGLVDGVLEHVRRAPSPFSAVQLRVLGGAMARVPAAATAFAHRDARLLLAIGAAWDGPDENGRHLAWTESLWATVRPHASGAYAGFLADEGSARVREAYPPATYARLAEVKRRYDPENVFRLNQNVPPAEAGG